MTQEHREGYQQRKDKAQRARANTEQTMDLNYFLEMVDAKVRNGVATTSQEMMKLTVVSSIGTEPTCAATTVNGEIQTPTRTSSTGSTAVKEGVRICLSALGLDWRESGCVTFREKKSGTIWSMSMMRVGSAGQRMERGSALRWIGGTALMELCRSTMIRHLTGRSMGRIQCC